MNKQNFNNDDIKNIILAFSWTRNENIISTLNKNLDKYKNNKDKYYNFILSINNLFNDADFRSYKDDYFADILKYILKSYDPIHFNEIKYYLDLVINKKWNEFNSFIATHDNEKINSCYDEYVDINQIITREEAIEKYEALLLEEPDEEWIIILLEQIKESKANILSIPEESHTIFEYNSYEDALEYFYIDYYLEINERFFNNIKII